MLLPVFCTVRSNGRYEMVVLETAFVPPVTYVAVVFVNRYVPVSVLSAVAGRLRQKTVRRVPGINGATPPAGVAAPGAAVPVAVILDGLSTLVEVGATTGTT